ncbi:Cupin-like domain-containing protein [Caulobacter sp. UNC279MFTsu5.1]|nr:Cupin-like domain-containing protein [Caulobacter sp. UNC279MFTsu5.1]
MTSGGPEPTPVELDAVEGWDAAGFARDLAQACRPIVLRGLCRDWPSTRAASCSWQELSDYLIGFDAGLRGQAFVGAPAIAGRYDYGDGPDGFNFDRESLTLRQTLERIDQAAADAGRTSIYMGSLPVDDYLPGFALDHQVAFLPATARPRVWLGNAGRVACHYDTYDNLACVVAGRRRFTLYPPDAVGDLYVGPIDHTLAGQPVGLAVGAEPDDPRFPRFENARHRAVVVELAAGDALYLPKLWWHQVEALEPRNLLVNYWWDGFSAGPDAPFVTMMLAMIAIAERPAAERQAWRAFFDHYVFRPNGHPLSHLSPSRHGILGPLADGNYGKIRASVMRMLRGG